MDLYDLRLAISECGTRNREFGVRSAASLPVIVAGILVLNDYSARIWHPPPTAGGIGLRLPQ